MVAMVRAVVCLSLWLAVCQVRGFTLPGEMNRTIQSILQHYNVKPRLIFNGKPVFPQEMIPEQPEAKKTVMGGVLNMYEKLFNQMLKGLPTPSPPTSGGTGTANDPQDGSVKTALNYLLTKIKDLKRYRYQEQEPEKVLKGLQHLKHVQTNDSVVQAKALWELSDLYQEASSLTNSTVEKKKQQQRRRRRQARKASKYHARG